MFFQSFGPFATLSIRSCPSSRIGLQMERIWSESTSACRNASVRLQGCKLHFQNALCANSCVFVRKLTLSEMGPSSPKTIAWNGTIDSQHISVSMKWNSRFQKYVSDMGPECSIIGRSYPRWLRVPSALLKWDPRFRKLFCKTPPYKNTCLRGAPFEETNASASLDPGQ